MQSSCSGKRLCGPCVKAMTALRPQRYCFSAKRATFSPVFSPFDREALFFLTEGRRDKKRSIPLILLMNRYRPNYLPKGCLYEY